VHLDGAQGDTERLRDVSVRQSFGRHRRDAAFARRERSSTGLDNASGSSASSDQLLARLFTKKHCTKSLRQLKRLAEMLTRFSPLIPAAKRCTEVRECVSVFEACW
jgi:hypothetical protein